MQLLPIGKIQNSIGIYKCSIKFSIVNYYINSRVNEFPVVLIVSWAISWRAFSTECLLSVFECLMKIRLRANFGRVARVTMEIRHNCG